jgi:hypothetical protein
MSVANRIIVDLMFYLGLPLMIWNFGRGFLGDYMAMFLSALTGILYTAFKFYTEKKYNITGIVIVFGITLNLLLNVISENALEILFNGIYLNAVFLALYLVSMMIKKPMGKIFYIDYRRMYGEEQILSQERSRRFTKRKYFYYLTGLFAFRESALLISKYTLITQLGIDGANQILLVNRILSYLFIGVIAVIVLRIDREWKKMIQIERVPSDR